MIESLGWTLLHFIWQGTLLAVLFALAALCLRDAGPRARYLAGCAALVLMMAAPLTTFLAMQNRSVQGIPRFVAAEVAGITSPSPTLVLPPVAPNPPRIEQYFPALVGLWLTGVVALTLWFCGGWLVAQRLTRMGSRPAPDAWQKRLAVLAALLGISRAVRLCESALAEVPTVIGWMRPVILLPVSALANLSPAQIEAILAHELAHIRRHDYLVNLLQTGAEILLFYHPAVWWIGRRIRMEREHCCDDLAVAACGDPIAYARALAEMEQIRIAFPQPALAANGGSLTTRIRRLVSGRESAAGPRGWVAALAPLIVLAMVGIGSQALVPDISAQNPAPPPAPAAAKVPAKPQPPAVLPAQPVRPTGFLAGLVAAGYTDLSVDEIIDLKNNGVTPAYMHALHDAGFGRPRPGQLIELRRNGVPTEFVREMAHSRIADLTIERLVPLQQNGVVPADVRRIHVLGFGPYTTEQVIELRRHGISPDFFEGLKDSGIEQVTVRDAVEARRHNVSGSDVRDARRGGFRDLTLRQIIQLKRAGVLSNAPII